MPFLRSFVPSFFIAMLTLALGAPASAQTGAVYYVSSAGSDTNPGTEALPWRTIQRAANAVNPGDTVYVRSGVYNEAVTISRSGAPDAFITLTAYPGEVPVVDANGLTLPNYFDGGFRISYANYVRIAGFVVQNITDGFGIICYHADNCIIENNRTYNTLHSGIASWTSTNSIIQNNEVELANNDGEQEAISVTQSANVQVLNNHVHHGGPGTNGGEGIDIKDGSHDILVKGNYVHHMNRVCLYVDAWDSATYNITLDGNRAHDCYRYGAAVASERGGELYNVTVINNLIYRNVRTGFIIGDWDAGYPHPMHDIAIIGNTMYDNGDDLWGGGIEITEPSVQGVVIRNNILSQNNFFTILAENIPLSALTVDHNLLDGFRGQAGELRGSDYVEGDPRFVNAAGADFRLLPDSPAIDHGSAAGAPDHDFAGDPRPSNSLWDIGAYEYQAGPQAPHANFSASPTGGVAPLAVVFHDLSSGEPTAWSWDFGDGGGSTGQHPTHDYATPGYYTVSLTASNALGQNTIVKNDFIGVRPAGAPAVIFSDDFETALNWTLTGDVTWYTGAPHNGAYGVRLRNTGSIEKTISTAGYRFITAAFSIGAGSLDNSSENMQALWFDSAAWVVLKQINNGDPEENNSLHPFQFELPQTADDKPALALRFKLNGSGTGDYGYIEDVIVSGFPSGATPTSTPTAGPTSTHTPTAIPTSTPTTVPTSTPTTVPTNTPTTVPTNTPTRTPTPAPTSTPTVTPTPGGALQRIFLDDFEAGLRGWYKEGKVAAYTGTPKIGARSVRLTGNNCWMQRTISTAGYSGIVVRVYMGAASYEASESLMIYWWDGAAWQQIKTIKNGAAEENGTLHFQEFSLPAAAENRADFKIAFGQWDAGSGDYGYLDNVEVLGVMR